jgi:hypothetical protein
MGPDPARCAVHGRRWRLRLGGDSRRYGRGHRRLGLSRQHTIRRQVSRHPCHDFGGLTICDGPALGGTYSSSASCQPPAADVPHMSPVVVVAAVRIPGPPFPNNPPSSSSSIAPHPFPPNLDVGGLFTPVVHPSAPPPPPLLPSSGVFSGTGGGTAAPTAPMERFRKPYSDSAGVSRGETATRSVEGVMANAAGEGSGASDGAAAGDAEGREGGTGDSGREAVGVAADDSGKGMEAGGAR